MNLSIATNLSTIMPFCPADAVAVAMREGPQPFKLEPVSVLVVHINETCIDNGFLAPGIPPINFINTVTTGNLSLAGSVTSWTSYETKDVFNRLADYKLPLVVLLLQAPHSPLGLRLGFFSRLHLFASPVDALGSYLYTLVECYLVLVEISKVMAGRVGKGRPVDEAGAKALTMVWITYAAEERPVSSMKE